MSPASAAETGGLRNDAICTPSLRGGARGPRGGVRASCPPRVNIVRGGVIVWAERSALLRERATRP